MLWGMTFSSFFISALVTYLLITAHPFTTGQHRSSLTARGAACTFEYAHGLALDVLRERAWPVAHVQRDSIEEVLLRPNVWGCSELSANLSIHTPDMASHTLVGRIVRDPALEEEAAHQHRQLGRKVDRVHHRRPVPDGRPMR